MRANILSLAFIAGLGMSGAGEVLAVSVENPPTLTIEWMDSDSGLHSQPFSLTPTGNSTYEDTIEDISLCSNDVCSGVINSLHVELDTDPYMNLTVSFTDMGTETTLIFTITSFLTLPDGAFDILLQGNIDKMVDGGSDGVSFTPATLFDGVTGPFGGMVNTSMLVRSWGTASSVAENHICPTCSYGGATFATAIGLTGSGGGDQYTASSTFTVTSASSIPEPATVVLFGVGLAGLGFRRGLTWGTRQ